MHSASAAGCENRIVARLRTIETLEMVVGSSPTIPPRTAFASQNSMDRRRAICFPRNALGCINAALWARRNSGYPQTTMSFWKKLFGAKELPTIHHAARDGHLDAVKALLKRSPSLVSSRNSDGFTPLYSAADSGHTDVAELLLANGAEVDATAKWGETPLAQAAARGHNEMVKLLLARGADVNAKDSADSTPLHRAAMAGRKDVAQLLLANKANASAKDFKSMTPLDWAAIQGHKGWEALLGQQHVPHPESVKIKVTDWRSPGERRLVRDAATASVHQSTEEQATQLLVIWRATEFDFYGPREDDQTCNECDATKVGRFQLTPVDDGFLCKSCGRRIVFAEYVVEDGNHYKHKIVIEIGEQLYRQGGNTAMQAAAHRFSALGGRMSDLSRCWHGIGEWMH
jgi:hypothetical protein